MWSHYYWADTYWAPSYWAPDALGPVTDNLWVVWIHGGY